MTQAEPNNSSSMVGRTIAGRYTIRATIGSGGMGFVYRATQSPIEREVALKVLRVDLAHQDGIAERFTREARAASRIQHPNAITIFEFGEDDGIFYLAMELLSGETLRQRMRREPKLEPEHALDIFEAMAGALAAAHRVGVVHRDLKPDNIFLAQFEGLGEVVKVLDFGLAKLLDRTADPEGLVTDVNLRLGTPRYMAPEQALGLQPIDARCDVYALGLLLFEMLAGRAPVVGEDGMEVLAQRLRREAPRLSSMAPDKGFSEQLDGLLAEMLERDRERRPADANVVVQRLRELRKGGLVYTERDPLLDAPEIRMSNPGVQPRPRKAALPSGYPMPGAAYGRPQASNPGVAQPDLGLDDFDKPTVVMSSRDELTPSGRNSSELTPVAQAPGYAPPQPYASPRPHPPAQGQAAGTMVTAQRPQLRPPPFQLSRRVIIALVVLALGAPIVALVIRWYQSRNYRIEAIEGPPAAAPAPPPPRAVQPAAAAPPPGGAAPPGATPGEAKWPPGRAPAEAPRPAATERTEARPRLCYIRIESNPPGAKVERDGQLLGTTPFVDSMPYGSMVVRYRVLADGYEPFEKSVAPEHRRTIVATLRPLGGGAAPRPQAPGPRRDSKVKPGAPPPPAPF